MSKKCTPLWREAHVEVKMYKTRHARTTFRHVEVKMYKTHQLRTTFGSCDHMLGPLFDVQMSFLVAGARDWCTLPKVSKTWGFCSISKCRRQAWDIWRRSAKICKDAFSVADAMQETCSIRDVRRSRALISWEGLHFGASDLQFWEDDFARQVQHFVWPGLTFFLAGAVL